MEGEGITPRRVVIIDPSETSGKLIARVLSRRRDDRTRLVPNAVAAWPLLERETPDAVFISLRDEALSVQATAFCHQVKATPDLRHVPVIVFGALAPKDICAELQEAGAAGYLYEPFPPRSIVEARDAALRGETYYP
jgi:CheY-like chemotaxis protein